MTTRLLICGSRAATLTMRSYACRVVARASMLGWHVIVGDAAGIDAEVMRTCCFDKVSFDVYGITSLPRNVCCAHHAVECYHRNGATFLERDRVMVEHADRIIGIWNKVSRGTKYTCDYAQSLGKPVDLIGFND